MTDKFEGCVVREMRRLDELMKNLHLAAKVSLVLSAVQPAVSNSVCSHLVEKGSKPVLWTVAHCMALIWHTRVRSAPYSTAAHAAQCVLGGREGGEGGSGWRVK